MCNISENTGHNENSTNKKVHSIKCLAIKLERSHSSNFTAHLKYQRQKEASTLTEE